VGGDAHRRRRGQLADRELPELSAERRARDRERRHDARREGAGGVGRHLESWRVSKVADITDSALTFTCKTTADGISMGSPTGESYDAKFGGKDYPVKGDRGGSTVMVRKVGDRTLEETSPRDGSVVIVSLIAAAGDGKSLSVVYEDKEQGTTTRYQARKQ
jgi:hypothetical protein